MDTKRSNEAHKKINSYRSYAIFSVRRTIYQWTKASNRIDIGLQTSSKVDIDGDC